MNCVVMVVIFVLISKLDNWLEVVVGIWLFMSVLVWILNSFLVRFLGWFMIFLMVVWNVFWLSLFVDRLCCRIDVLFRSVKVLFVM